MTEYSQGGMLCMQSFKNFLWLGIIDDVYFVHISNVGHLLMNNFKNFTISQI